MKAFIIAYLSVTVAFLVLDGIWLGLVAKGFYARQLDTLMRPDFLLLPALVFYLLYAFGLVWFAVLPAQFNGMALTALNGAILGLLAYGTYNLTNLATLKNWPLTMSLVDMAWGTIMSAAIATAAALILRHFTHP